MTQRLKALSSLAEDPGLVLALHGNSQLPETSVFWAPPSGLQEFLHVCGIYKLKQTHTIKQINTSCSKYMLKTI